MAKFSGTLQEFNKYLGGYCKNKVLAITRPYNRLHHGICQKCKTKHELQAAHVKGEERVVIIRRILETHFASMFPDEYIVDLDMFEKFFIAAHQPIENHFLFLCQACHLEYDSGNITNTNAKETILSATVASQQPQPAMIGNQFFYKLQHESIQDYVKRLLPALFSKGMLTSELLLDMQDKSFCKSTFGINWPLLEQNSHNIKDACGHNRYWSNYLLNNTYYVCSQWWKGDFALYEQKLHKWVDRLLSQADGVVDA